MKTIAIIPARYGSKRLVGKPLIQIQNKPLIQITYEAVLTSNLFDAIFITTESKKIQQVAASFGATCIMTSDKCKNGTERCAELSNKLDLHRNDIIINVQCDEPFIEKKHLEQILNLFNPKTQIGTLLSSIQDDEIHNESIVKAITTKDNTIINFSRKKNNLDNMCPLYKHIGIYGYRKQTLIEIAALKITKRELAEKLEQLRWIENDYRISCDFVAENLISINTKNDIKNL